MMVTTGIGGDIQIYLRNWDRIEDYVLWYLPNLKRTLCRSLFYDSGLFTIFGTFQRFILSNRPIYGHSCLDWPPKVNSFAASQNCSNHQLGHQCSAPGTQKPVSTRVPGYFLYHHNNFLIQTNVLMINKGGPRSATICRLYKA